MAVGTQSGRFAQAEVPELVAGAVRGREGRIVPLPNSYKAETQVAAPGIRVAVPAIGTSDADRRADPASAPIHAITAGSLVNRVVRADIPVILGVFVGYPLRYIS